MSQRKIEVKGIEIRIKGQKGEDYVCLTDIARFGRSDPKDTIRGYIRARANVEFLGLWEQLNNKDFKVGEFTHFKNELGSRDFYPSISMWITHTNAIGIFSKSGRYGGTYGHSDIAVQFATWLSPAFYLLFVKEFQRLKEDEAKKLGKPWNLRRELSRANYHIHTDAVRENLVPIMDWNTKHERIQFASEADLLNLAVFGMTAKEWKLLKPEAKGNQRDYASELELQVLGNMESLNAALIQLQFSKKERLDILTARVDRELKILEDTKTREKLKRLK